MEPGTLSSFLPAAVFLVLIHFSINGVKGWNQVDPLIGFRQLPLSESNLEVQRPYNLPVNQRYSIIDGVHRMWVLSTDKPHSLTSHTNARSEIGIRGYNYSSGAWQFEGYAYVPNGTTGVCIMQIFGAANHATTLMIRVYNDALTYYKDPIVDSCIYDRWFRLNVIHDVDGGKVCVYIDGHLKLYTNDRGGNSHSFKFGVYAQDNASYYMESRWKGIKVLQKM